MKSADRYLALIALAVVLVLGGCGQQTPERGGAPGPSGASSEIFVMVPCGQVGPFSEAKELFLTANPGVEIRSVPENIVTITAQILDGKMRPDLFLSMGDLEVDRVEQAGLVVEGTRTKYAENSLGLMVPKGNPAGVQTIADLAKPGVKNVAMPDPKHNSVGKHGRQALETAGIWNQVADKLFIMPMAADTKDATAQSRVQASIGYYPCAVEVHIEGQAPAEPKKLKLLGQIPADLYDPFWCEGAVIKGSKNPEGGRKLLDFLTTPQVQEIFRKWQFVQEAPESPAA